MRSQVDHPRKKSESSPQPPSQIKLCNFKACLPLAMLPGTHQPGRDMGLHLESHLLQGQKFHLPKNFNCVKRTSLVLLYLQTRIFYRGTDRYIFTYGHRSPVNTQHSKHFLYSTPMLQLKQSLSQYREENSEVFSESDCKPCFSFFFIKKLSSINTLWKNC